MFDLNWVNCMLKYLYKLTTTASIKLMYEKEALHKIKNLTQDEPEMLENDEAEYIYDVAEYFGMKMYGSSKILQNGIGEVYAYN